jgi:hypothetical protein
MIYYLFFEKNSELKKTLSFLVSPLLAKTKAMNSKKDKKYISGTMVCETESSKNSNL